MQIKINSYSAILRDLILRGGMYTTLPGLQLLHMQFKLLLLALFCTGGTCTTLESVRSVTINSNAVILLDVILCG